MQNLSKLSITLLFIFIGRFAIAQDMIKESRPASGFTSIKVSGIANVFLTQGNQEKVNIEVNNKDFNHRLKVEVVNHVLVIRMENNDNWKINNYNNVKVKVYVTYKELNSITGSGATNFESENVIKGNDFDIKLSGANNTKLQLDVRNLNIETSGASNINLSGKAVKVNVKSSGASNIKAFDLHASDVVAQSSGVSNTYITIDKTLDVKASGMSNVTYSGNAEVVSKSVSKMANIHKRN